MSHTYVILECSEAAYNEVAAKLRAADYYQAFHTEADGTVLIDMHGIALQAIHEIPLVDPRGVEESG